MNYRYDTIDCPICEKKLDSGEVVVCPDCGAPYHKECYLSQGQCLFPELHEKGEAWAPPKPEESAEYFDGNAQLRCSRCGTVNPPQGLFCQVCGNSLSPSEQPAGFNPDASQRISGSAPPSTTNNAQGMGGFSFQGGQRQSGGYNPQDMPLNPYTTPFGGVAPDEEIDGLPAKDLAIFVGRNSHYYLPRFKEQTTAKIRMLNWASFIFTGGHFIYRKMYGLGIMVILLEALISIPNTILLYQTLSSASNTAFATTMPNYDLLTNLNFIANLVGMGLRFACGVLGNVFYKKHVYKKIRRLKSEATSEEGYLSSLAKKGSVAIKLISGLLIGYMGIYILSLVFIMLMGI